MAKDPQMDMAFRTLGEILNDWRAGERTPHVVYHWLLASHRDS
jgi:hypothetical protein